MISPDELFICGEEGPPRPDTYIFKFSTNTLRKRADMNYPRAGHAIKKVHRSIYVFGNINAPQDTAERYLIETDKWVKMPNMPIAVSHAN